MRQPLVAGWRRPLGEGQRMIALGDAALARLVLAASRLPAASDRVRLLRAFARAIDPPKPSRAAINMRRHRQRVRDGIVVCPVPLGAAHYDVLVRCGFIAERDLGDSAAVGRAAADAIASAGRYLVSDNARR